MKPTKNHIKIKPLLPTHALQIRIKQIMEGEVIETGSEEVEVGDKVWIKPTPYSHFENDELIMNIKDVYAKDTKTQ